MQRSLVSTLLPLLALPVCFLLLPASPAHAQLKNVPQLGSPLPASLNTADKHEKRCHTADVHLDPCTEVEIGNVRYTIAWDEQTKAITYLFTADPHILTDNGLAVGNSLRVADAGTSDPVVPYMKWMIDPKWKDTDGKLGAATWYAVLHKDDYDRHFGDVVGFVQSSYLQLKP
jgi:hypothetical protein